MDNKERLPPSVAAGFFPEVERRMPKKVKATPLDCVDQISIVVADIDEAIEYYGAAFGWGPFYVAEVEERGRYRGRMSEYHLKLAFYALTDELEIELIQHITGDTPHLEHINEKGPGLFHLRLKSDAIEQDLASLEEQGIRSIWDYAINGIVVNAYLDSHRKCGVRTELIRPLEQLKSIVKTKFSKPSE